MTTRTLRACAICARPVTHGNRCPAHPHHGYGHQHRRTRAELLPHAYGTPCPRCGQAMQPSQPLDLDHGTRADGYRMAHANCNRGG